MINKSELLLAIKEVIRKASVELPLPVVDALKKAYTKETTEIAKTILASILDNINLAKKLNRPLCQDTGVPNFFIEIGNEFNLSFNIEEILTEALKQSTIEIPLRPNSVDLINQKNTGDNTGRFIPFINYEFIKGDTLKIIYFPKGAGSENQSSLLMINPSESFKKIEDIIYNLIVNKIQQSCPPILLGIGMGGGADIALHLAKKALLRDLGLCHKEKRIAELEKNILGRINDSGIGPMGLGGKTTALAVHIEYAYRHPASFPLGVVFQCWAARKSEIIIDNEGRYNIN